MESRKEFINRMAWMLSEIDDSKFKTLDSLSMVDFHLKQRELDLLNQTKDLIMNYMEYRANKKLRSGIDISLGKLIIYTQQEFEHIIKKLE